MNPANAWQPLIDAALEARRHAHAPYSRFPVGAAIRWEDGSITAGANVENRTFGLTVCAERSAVSTAVSRGLRHPAAVAVITASSPPAPPCGMCRESLAEFADDLPILLLNTQGERREVSLAALLPERFVFPPPA